MERNMGNEKDPLSGIHHKRRYGWVRKEKKIMNTLGETVRVG